MCYSEGLSKLFIDSHIFLTNCDLHLHEKARLEFCHLPLYSIYIRPRELMSKYNEYNDSDRQLSITQGLSEEG